MPCYSPITGYRAREINKGTGKRSIVFNPKMGCSDEPVTLPCGQCIGCKLDRSRQWAIRCVHEANLYQHNIFVTLTYDEGHLPLGGSLQKEHFQKFMKRLRKFVALDYSESTLGGPEIRFFHCGEYGEKFGRPHYHACIFNLDFKDKKLVKYSNGLPIYSSGKLSELWPQGLSAIGDVTFESAAYVARYITKKITGPKALEHYTTFDKKTGEIYLERNPEYVTMSRRPGIGRPWLEKYKTDVYPDDFVIIRGKKMRPPKYYDLRFEIDDPDTFGMIQIQRKQQVNKSLANSTWERLAVREEIQLRKFDLLKRGYENDL